MISARVAIAALFLMSTDYATAYTGADQLIKDCTSVPVKPDEAFRQVRCTGYVGGVLDTYAVVSSVHRNVNIYFAPQGGLTADVALSALVEWVRSHPDKANTPARSALLFAMREKFPCR